MRSRAELEILKIFVGLPYKGGSISLLPLHVDCSEYCFVWSVQWTLILTLIPTASGFLATLHI